jgi:IS30 family transposase
MEIYTNGVEVMTGMNLGVQSSHNRTGIPNRVDIDQRPEAVNNREVFGHWEADTIIGKAYTGTIVTVICVAITLSIRPTLMYTTSRH